MITFLIILCIAMLLLNPIMFLIRFELYDAKYCIEELKWKRAHEISDIDEINAIRPTLKDFWKYISNGDNYYVGYRTWWWPVIGNCIFVYYIFYLIFRPLNSFYKKFIKWFGNIKV